MRKSLVALALVAVSGVVFSEWFLNPKPVDEVERTEPDHLCKGCNVVLLSADSVRADRLPMYGYYRDTTPAILEFSKQAVVFQNYFAAGTLTPTSEAAVHTGRYPVTNGFSGFQTKMSLDSLTMAEVFKKSGYSTAAFMTSPEFFSRPNMKESFSRGYDHYYTQWRTSFHARDLKWSEYRKWLRKQRRTGKPFFTWVALGTAHWPFGTHAPRKFNNPRYRGILSRIDRIESSLLQHAVFQLIYDGYLYSRNGREIFIGRFDGTAGGSEPDPIEKK
ncbi:MAG: sulfatase-like hydrolase/transferase, partial [Bdellovibrionales bacterium]|nr:sulfatase-like hydrolase/transferase [Bdellovibrionales bacterium]